MDDLQALRVAPAVDDPSQGVVDRSRHLLQNRVRGGRPPGSTPTAGPPAPAASAPEILLAAATSAGRAPRDRAPTGT